MLRVFWVRSTLVTSKLITCCASIGCSERSPTPRQRTHSTCIHMHTLMVGVVQWRGGHFSQTYNLGRARRAGLVKDTYIYMYHQAALRAGGHSHIIKGALPRTSSSLPSALADGCSLTHYADMAGRGASAGCDGQQLEHELCPQLCS